MTNYDVIEAYIEDFTKWAYRDSRGTAKITNNTIVITNVVKTNNIVEELINSVKDKVANSPRGKELLEKQLNNIRTKKDSIIEEANRGLELFKKFQIAAQANPKLTYVEFCKTINNE